ncbi:MAG TPA: tripartite tricarboxylate transporter substrate-binding protein [Roseomonas sp.]|jgi:putative tricarboxylic transport membrane protein
MNTGWRPTAPLRLLAGTPPGGGLDRVARALAGALAETGMLDTPAEVVNIPGDGARLVWRGVLDRLGDPHLLSISSTNLTTDRLLGLADFGHAEITPAAILVSEAIAFGVPAASPLRDGTDLLRRLGAGPAGLRIVLATALGNPNHIALAQLARHAGVDPATIDVHAVDGAPQAVAAVLAGTAQICAVSAASTAPALRDGSLRVLAVSAPGRLPGPLAAVPTWREQGVPCTIGAWRGVSGPPGMPAAAIAFWSGAIAAATRTAAWQAALRQQSWTSLPLYGEALARYLTEEEAALRSGLVQLGLLAEVRGTTP